MGVDESAALLERVLAGDLPVIRELIAESWPRAGFAFGRVAADREELEQVAAQHLFEAARSYTAAAGPFRPYAVERLRRQLVRFVSRERRRRARFAPLETQAEPSAEMRTRVNGEVEDPRLFRALRRLSPRLRALIARIYWDGATNGELAAEEGADPRAIRAARRRAERALRRYLA
jgi:RNA polymerase sigma factor (sigma-70 family)